MELKYLGILFSIMLIASFSFAAAPTVSQPTVSPSVTTDLNYFGEPVTITATGSGDVNTY